MLCTYDYPRRRLRLKHGNRRGGKPKPTASPMPFGRLVEAERLTATYRRLREQDSAPGPDGVRYSDLPDREACAIFRDAAAAIRTHGYRPWERRIVPIPKASGGVRPISIRSVVNRVIACRVKDGLERYFDPRFAPWSVGFRPGLSTWHALAAVDLAVRNGASVFGQADIIQAFPSLPLDRLIAVFADHLNDRRTLGLVEAILRGGEDLDRARGIDMGCPFSPFALNVYCDALFDRLFRAVDVPARVRYADNLGVLNRAVPEGAMALSEAAGLFEAAGLQLKKDDPADLRDQSLTTHPVDFLGFRFAGENGRLRLSVPPKAWEGLGELIAEARTAEDPAYAAHAAVKGWVSAYGPALGEARGDCPCARVRETARKAGFRELQNGCVERRAGESYRRWTRLLREEPGRQSRSNWESSVRSSLLTTPPAVEAERGS